MADIIVRPITQLQDSFAADSPTSFEPSKPVLPRMIKLHGSLGKTGDQISHNLLDRLENESKELKIVSQKQLDHLQAMANRTWAEQAWSYLDVITNGVVALFNLAAGSYVLASGAGMLTGGALIAAGIFNILQIFFNHTGGWDWVTEALAEKNQALKDRLKLALPFTLFILNTAFNLLSYQGYTLLTGGHRNLVNLIEQFQAFMGMASQASRSYFSIKQANADANLVKIQGDLRYHEQNADLLSRLVEYSIQEVKRIKSTIKKPINSLMQATTLAAQKV